MTNIVPKTPKSNGQVEVLGKKSGSARRSSDKQDYGADAVGVYLYVGKTHARYIALMKSILGKPQFRKFIEQKLTQAYADFIEQQHQVLRRDEKK
jgi:hypothetical protein